MFYMACRRLIGLNFNFFKSFLAARTLHRTATALMAGTANLTIAMRCAFAMTSVRKR